MKLLINLAPLKIGGGQNVALNFVQCLRDLRRDGIEFFFVVSKGSRLHEFLANDSTAMVIVAPVNPVFRMMWEATVARHLVFKNGIDIIYSYFGMGLYPRSVPQITGSADSNIYCPEVNFWSNVGFVEKIKKRIIDEYRIYGVKKADAVIFENQFLEERGRRLLGLQKTKLIKPSINYSYVSNKYALSIPGHCAKGLFLCGWQDNKNYNMIPSLAKSFKEKGVSFHFILTAGSSNRKKHDIFMGLVRELDVDNMISVVDNVEKEYLPSLYDQIDYVFLLSKLESFSNNIIESWAYSKVLVVSNLGWAKSLCGDAAVYVDRDNVCEITAKIAVLEADDSARSEMLTKGQKALSMYPSVEDRTKQEMQYIKEIYENS